MHRRFTRAVGAALLAAALASLGCRHTAPPPAATETRPDIVPTAVRYVDSDGFDNVLEAAFVAQAPVIVVRTDFTAPDWGPRLNAWVAAWNRGGRSPGRVARGQSPVPRVDADTVRELRLLVNGLLDRVEGAAQTGSVWYAEERTRSRRVALLRPYNLRFHMGDDGLIQLVFFHGSHAADYPRFVQRLTRSATPPDEAWSRGVECSRCPGGQKEIPGQLTGLGAD